MAHSTPSSRAGKSTPPIAPNLAETQKRNAALLARASQVMADTTRALLDSEMEFYRLQAESIARIPSTFKPGNHPVAMLSAYCDQCQDTSERMLSHMRTVNDLMRQCGWDLFQLYQDNLQEAVESAQTQQ